MRRVVFDLQPNVSPVHASRVHDTSSGQRRHVVLQQDLGLLNEFDGKCWWEGQWAPHLGVGGGSGQHMSHGVSHLAPLRPPAASVFLFILELLP